VLISPKGDQLLYVIRLHFCDTHNVAEYEALANSLRITVELRVQWLYIRGDCELIINQVMGESNCHDSHIVPYCHGVRRLEGEFNGLSSIISSDEIARQLMPSLDLDQAMNHPL
jgi:ribonuclease HI